MVMIGFNSLTVLPHSQTCVFVLSCFVLSPLQERLTAEDNEKQVLRFPSPLVFCIPGSKPRNYIRARSATVGVVEEEVALAVEDWYCQLITVGSYCFTNYTYGI